MVKLDKYLNQISLFSRILVILMGLNIILIYVGIFLNLNNQFFSIFKYISAVIGILFGLFLIFYFYLGYFEGICKKKAKFVKDSTRIRKPYYWIYFLVGLIAVIFFIVRLINILN